MRLQRQAAVVVAVGAGLWAASAAQAQAQAPRSDAAGSWGPASGPAAPGGSGGSAPGAPRWGTQGEPAWGARSGPGWDAPAPAYTETPSLEPLPDEGSVHMGTRIWISSIVGLAFAFEARLNGQRVDDYYGWDAFLAYGGGISVGVPVLHPAIVIGAQVNAVAWEVTDDWGEPFMRNVAVDTNGLLQLRPIVSDHAVMTLTLSGGPTVQHYDEGLPRGLGWNVQALLGAQLGGEHVYYAFGGGWAMRQSTTEELGDVLQFRMQQSVFEMTLGFGF